MNQSDINHRARRDEALRRLMNNFKVDGLTRALTRQLATKGGLLLLSGVTATKGGYCY